MGKLVYRMCLVVVLMAVIVGGVYYYMSIYQMDEEPDRGTFVDNMVEPAEEVLA